MNPLKEKRGQAILEYVLVAPLFLAAFLMVIDVGWVSYQRVLFDYTVRHASWEWRPSGATQNIVLNGHQRVFSGSVANDALRDQLINENNLTSHLRTSDITVRNGRINVYPGVKFQRHKTRFGSDDGRRRLVNMETKADVDYIMRPITPVGRTLLGNEIPTSRSMYKLYNIQSRR
ncbi:Flp pilus assembly protein TadG [Tindallia magadiensis]|uniref:Flp pilus assembly protein TadG n=1 Tax=Tindallia magadiensis TaxID=69895 RepID=A0A1I3EJ25_9FIRM|nr:TadE family protein [Tindallia magadiensis]SFH98966.1 Flp pilus assembly protein TadG [Tindallia magadiensis]